METVRTIYKELFSIKFLHSGYGQPRSNSIADNIRIKPDRITSIYLNNYNIGYRFDGDRFVCFMRSRLVSPPARDPQEPFVRDASAISLRFLITSSSDFIAKTFAVNAGSKWVYQFSNRISNVEDADPDDFIYLNQDIEMYNPANDYFEGTVVRNAGELYAAIKTVKASANIAITDDDCWKSFTVPQQVVNNADLKPVAAEPPSEKCFGVIDIHYTGTVNPYNLFGAGQQLLSPVYTLSFKSKI